MDTPLYANKYTNNLNKTWDLLQTTGGNCISGILLLSKFVSINFFYWNEWMIWAKRQSISWQEQVTFIDVRFVLDQHVDLDLYNANSVKQQSNSRHVASLGHIIGVIVDVIVFTTTIAISAYHHWCCEFEFRSRQDVQHHVIKFVSDLQLVCGFLRVLRFLYQ